jgi:hypothetical protein
MKETAVSWRRIATFFLLIGPPAVIAGIVVSHFTQGLGGTSRIVLGAVVFGAAQAVGTWLANSRWGALVFGRNDRATQRPAAGALPDGDARREGDDSKRP